MSCITFIVSFLKGRQVLEYFHELLYKRMKFSKAYDVTELYVYLED